MCLEKPEEIEKQQLSIPGDATLEWGSCGLIVQHEGLGKCEWSSGFSDLMSASPTPEWKRFAMLSYLCYVFGCSAKFRKMFHEHNESLYKFIGDEIGNPSIIRFGKPKPTDRASVFVLSPDDVHIKARVTVCDSFVSIETADKGSYWVKLPGGEKDYILAMFSIITLMLVVDIYTSMGFIYSSNADMFTFSSTTPYIVHSLKRVADVVCWNFSVAHDEYRNLISVFE